MPTTETVKKILAAISTKAEADYFLDTIKSPDWIGPLAAADFFTTPPGPIVDGDGVRFPVWHESQYLARVAHLAPDQVLEVILGIPETQNPRVHEDLIDVALAIPAQLAVSLTDRATRWAESPYQLLLPLKLAALALHFARGGESRSALDVTRSLLSIRPGDFEYERVLGETVPQLVKLIGVPVYDLLSELLDDGLQRFRGQGDAVPADDQSRIWHPDLEEGRPYEYGGSESHLVSAVLNAAILIAEQNPGQVKHLVHRTRSHNWGISHRLSLDILRRFPTAAGELVQERLLDRAAFDSTLVGREYGRLLQERFASLDEGSQRTILTWIDEGPDLDRFKGSPQSRTGEAPSGQETNAYVKQWQLEWLGLIAPTLPPDWRARYDELVRDFGPATDAHVTAHQFRMFSGTASPKNAAELGAMAIDEIVRFLSEWEPNGAPGTPSREGLALALAAAVAADPVRFSAQASAFSRPSLSHYSMYVLNGFWAAVRDHQRPFPWEGVLALCRDFMAHPVPDSFRRSASNEDEGTPRIVPQLLQAGLRSGETEIPIGYRAGVWGLLSSLATHRDPTPETEATYGGTNMDPVALSLNHVRGAAMNAMIDYAIWVWRHTDEDERVAGFELMPEVRAALEWHLDPSNDPALAVRSVYGRTFPVLNAIDAGWTSDNLRRIFPQGEEERALWESAWGAFLLYAKLFAGAVTSLFDVYQDAVDSLNRTALVPWRATNIELRLAEHLMTFFWHGRLDLDETDGLLSRFYANAPLMVRGQAIDFVGRSLQSGESVDQEVLARLEQLWEARLAFVRDSADSAANAKELASFGWWFYSGRFDDGWALDQLLEVLRLEMAVHPDWLVAERLVSLAETYPRQSLECMRLVVEAAERKWGIGLILESVRGLVRILYAGSDAVVRAEATGLVNWLGARGYRDLRGVGEPGV